MDDLEMDKQNMILAALTIGFKDIGDNNLQCTKEQLIALMAIVANTAIEQALASEDKLNG